MSHNVSDPDRSQKELFRQVLTAGGAKVNAANRWFDKTIQVKGGRKQMTSHMKDLDPPLYIALAYEEP